MHPDANYRNDPKSARRPIPRPRAVKGKVRHTGLTNSQSEKTEPLDMDGLTSSHNEADDVYVTTSDSLHTPLRVPSSDSQASPRVRGTRTPKTPRRSKKATAEAEQTRREAYAQELFEDLNNSVFQKKLPPTRLNWSKRLLTTAGRARWHRSRSGQELTEIELATKVLDSDGTL
jgi:hypothetical protein